jgi:DNA-binding transcriptional regulator YiaG
MTRVDDAMRVRVIRALLGLDSKSFASRLGVSAGTLTAWEKSRATPQLGKRETLAKLCQESGIAFLPSGMPVPAVDCLVFKKEEI